jgi:hemoglobin
MPRVLADPRVNWRRTGITHGGLSIHREESMQWDASAPNVKMLKAHMAQFLGLATGGPSLYTGKDMRSAHENMHITNPEFDAAVGDLKATLDKLQIANQEQKELLSIVESTREQIVEER